ncbi:MAG: cellulase family glycosylhydrolase [Agriterribacter sp.]
MNNLFVALFAITVFSFCNCGDKDNGGVEPPTEPSVTIKDDMQRGFTITSRVTEQDIKDLKAYGANIVRVVYGYYKLISKTIPYNYNEDEFENLDRIIGLCEKYGLRIVINPHTAPGLESSDYTCSPYDPFWTSAEYQDILANLWKKISDRYKSKGGVIFGYDLLNEPFVPNDQEIWNRIVTRLTKLIRDNGDKHPVIIEPHGYQASGVWIERVSNIGALKLPVDDSIIVSPHVYDPLQYTHQEVIASYPEISYSAVGGKTALENSMKPIVDFQKKYPDVQIYIGEFSVVRSAEDGDQFIKDAIDFFENQKWHWTIHSFREAYPWDVEMPLGTNDMRPRSSTASRITLLKNYFEKNK